MDLQKLLGPGRIVERGKRKLYKLFLEKPVAKLFYHLPVKKGRIVFSNFNGKGYGDSVKYIADGLIRTGKGYELNWLVDNLESFEFPPEIRPVKVDSIRALYLRATAQVWVNNIRNHHPVKKKECQIFLQTWHAPFGPKKSEGDVEEMLGKEYVTAAKYDGQIANGILSNSKLLDEVYQRAFWLGDRVEILRFGLPRNDFLASRIGDEGERRRIREKFGFSEDAMYILYAPTFRDDGSLDGYRLDFENIAAAFAEKYGKPAKIVVRLHPNVARQSGFLTYDDRILNGTVYPDMQELSLACDAIISDYSSCIFDFVILRKPAFLCALDLEDYEKLRGLVPEFYSFPFPLATTNGQMLENIRNFDEKAYFTKVDRYTEQYPIYDKGDATERTVDWILRKMEEQDSLKG